jgi:hypothetical protein
LWCGHDKDEDTRMRTEDENCGMDMDEGLG